MLLHGIYARKEHWVDVAEEMVHEYHVIALDLPGFGDNAVLDIEDYEISKQSKHLALVIDALNLDEFHIGANSMGAYIATKYVGDFPERSKTLSFIGSPLGVLTPIKSDMEIAMESNELPLLATTPKKFYARNDWLSPNRIHVPSPVLKTWMHKEVAQSETNRSIWDIVHADLVPITELGGIDTYAGTTLILWCEDDRIFHFSGAEVLSRALERPRVEVLQDCGHVPMLDQPKLTAAKYKEFLQSQPL